MPPSSQRGIAEVNGARLAYELAGDGPPLALIHGFTLDQRMWHAQLPALTERWRVLRYDLRGFGRSSDPREGEPYTHAADLRALLEQLDLAPAVIVGLSMGGWVAGEFALTYPEATSALVLVDAVLREHRFGPVTNAALREVYGLARAEGMPAARERWLADPLFAYSATLPPVAAQLRAMVEDYAGWQLLHADPHPPLTPHAITRLEDIHAPTLVLTGAHDLDDFQTIADIYAARIPHARRVTLPDAGHMANMDNPAAFNAALREFLEAL